jgi:hypothetical protein
MTLGFKSTEFWVSLACFAVGLVLIWRGFHRDVALACGSALVVTATASYAHARGRFKGRSYPVQPGGGRL